VELQWPATEFVAAHRNDNSLGATIAFAPMAVVRQETADVVGDARMTLKDRQVKRITLNVDVAEARDLLERVPRACVAFTSDKGPHVELATVRFQDDRYLVGMPSSAASHLTHHQEVVLLIDDGVQFFDLRAIYVRGHVHPLGAVESLAGDLCWFEVQPTRNVAWDYARLREVDDES
jgi:hypothetical protein